MNKKIPVHPFGEETDDIWNGPDYIHEISDSSLKNRLSHKFWSGVLIGMTVTFASTLAGFLFFK